MRWAVLAICVLGLATSGCFNPKVASGGFACVPTDDPPCPTGFFCVNGLCVDHPGPDGAVDMSAGGALDFAGASLDMSTTDMASSMPDLAMGGSDMSCYPFGFECNGEPTCCSRCCAGGCASIGWCALF
jgi:hypothetical protein